MPSKKDILDLQFVQNRHRLIDLAAFLDRLDRHEGAGDYRSEAFAAALPILLSARPDRARGILEAFYETSAGLPQTAPFQGAFGAAQPTSSQ
jgi:hypothetical protein